MNVRWTRRAVLALTSIRDTIAKDNVSAANDLWQRIRSYVETTLMSHPSIGRPGRVTGTRESVVHRNYIIVYRITGDVIEILTVRHVAQKWPSQF